MKYDITLAHIRFDGTASEKISLIGVSEAMALKALEVYGRPGYEIKICGYTELKVEDKGERNED